jgi:hypothetical protein
VARSYAAQAERIDAQGQHSDAVCGSCMR